MPQPVVPKPSQPAPPSGVTPDAAPVPSAAPSPDLEAARAARLSAFLAAHDFSSIDELLDAHDQIATTPQETAMPVPPNPGSAPPATASSPAPASASPAGQPAARGAAPAGDRNLPPHIRQRLSREREEWQGRVTAAEQQRLDLETKYAEAQAQLDQARVENEIKVEMVRAGVKDLDYAFFSWKKHANALSNDKSPEGVQKYKQFCDAGPDSVKTWAEQQRATAPYIFGEQPVPATTGAVTGAPPPATVPGAPGVSASVAAAGAFDAKKASPDDFSKRMADLGISYTNSAPPMRR